MSRVGGRLPGWRRLLLQAALHAPPAPLGLLARSVPDAGWLLQRPAACLLLLLLLLLLLPRPASPPPPHHLLLGCCLQTAAAAAAAAHA
jgi:hypothetical protein